MKNPFKKYADAFSPAKFWEKLKLYASKAGVKVVYSALLLFYAYRRKETPTWAKNVVLGTLGYFLSPIDAIPDLTPFLGFTDDIGVLSFGLVTIAAYINDDIRKQARERLGKWFDQIDEEDLRKVDEQV